jgi:ankyrin repeat protein
MHNPDEVDCVNSNEDTLLHIYCGRSQERFQDLILRLRPNMVHKENKQGRTPIFNAIDARNANLMDKILTVDMSTLYHFDNEGTTALKHACGSGGTETLVVAWRNHMSMGGEPYRPDLFLRSLGIPSNAKFLVDNMPDITDFRQINGYNIFHIIADRSTYASSIVHHICNKFGTDLVAMPDNDGRLPIHIASNTSVLRTLYEKCPESVYVRDARGRTPFHKTTDWSTDASLEIFHKHPDILDIQDIDGMTIAMHKARSYHVSPKEISTMFELRPESFLLKNTNDRTFLHVLAKYKPSGWVASARCIVERYPHLIFDKERIGTTVLDYAIGIGGYDNHQLAKEEFIAMCLGYVSVPLRYWIFHGSVPSMAKSFGAILLRSEEEAKLAFVLLPKSMQTFVQTLLCCLRDSIESNLTKTIVSKACSDM